MPKSGKLLRKQYFSFNLKTKEESPQQGEGTGPEDSSIDVALYLVEFAPLKKMTKQISKWQQEFRWS